MICRMLSTIKATILIVLAAMLTIAYTEAHPNPKDSFECDAKDCDWLNKVRSYCSAQIRCQRLIHPCASECLINYPDIQLFTGTSVQSSMDLLGTTPDEPFA